MSKENEKEYIDIPTVLPCPITRQELGLLNDMFQSSAWKVWKKLKTVDLTKSMDIAMSLTADETQRAMHRAVYHVLLSDVTIEHRLVEESNNGAIVSEQDAQSQRDVPEHITSRL